MKQSDTPHRKELEKLMKNHKALNINTNKYLFFGLCCTALLVGLILQFLIFKDATGVVVGYIPFVIVIGIVFRSFYLLLLLTVIVSLVSFSGKEFETQVFLARETSFFLISFVIGNLIQNLNKERDSLVVLASTLSQSLDKRDQYTSFHSNNVAYYSFEIAKAMKLSKEDCFHLYLGGLLHDIGKIGVPESILKKPSRLTDEEFSIIKKHPEQGYEILKDVPYMKKTNILDMVRYHHERLDGKGYPCGLKGYDIPLPARIMAVADSFDAMTSRRVYQKDFDLEYAICEIEKGKGTQFDPNIADVFLKLLKEEKLEIKGYSDQPDEKTDNLNQNLSNLTAQKSVKSTTSRNDWRGTVHQ